jgi:hypothetical protein
VPGGTKLTLRPCHVVTERDVTAAQPVAHDTEALIRDRDLSREARITAGRAGHRPCSSVGVRRQKSLSLQDRIVRLETLLDQFARECAALQPLDPRKAEHFSETCDELRGMIERLRAAAAAADSRPEVGDAKP